MLIPVRPLLGLRPPTRGGRASDLPLMHTLTRLGEHLLDLYIQYVCNQPAHSHPLLLLITLFSTLSGRPIYETGLIYKDNVRDTTLYLTWLECRPARFWPAEGQAGSGSSI